MRSADALCVPFVAYLRSSARVVGQRLILELEADFLQALERAFAEVVLNFCSQTRRIRNRIALLLAFRHDHNQKAGGFARNVAETAVLSARHRNHVEGLEHELVLAMIAPSNLETAAEAKKILNRVEMAVKTGPVARLAFGDTDDEAARTLDRRASATPLVIRRRHDRINAPRCNLFDGAGRNAMRLEVLPLVSLQFVEPGDAGFHRLGSERFHSHGDPAWACCLSMIFFDLASPAEASNERRIPGLSFAQAGNRRPSSDQVRGHAFRDLH